LSAFKQSAINMREKLKRLLGSSPYFYIATWVVAFSTLYYLYFVRQFLRGDIVMGGDTQLLWSLNYLAFYSLGNLGEFLWWDPTTINGWPAYVNLTSGWFNYLGPYSLPSLALFLVCHAIAEIDINSFLVVEKTLYYFVLNVLAVVLISRELIKHPLARVLPPLIFTLSAVQFHGFRDSVLYEVMPAPLFYVFALIRYNNRRTVDALIMLLVFVGLYIASLNYGALQTSLWWSATFTIFLVVFYPNILRSVSLNIRDLRARSELRPLLWVMPIFLVAAFLAFYVPVHFNLGELVRVRGLGIVDYDVGVYGGFQSDNPNLPMQALSHPVWTTFLYWSPFEVLHDYFLVFDEKTGGAKAGVDHRYIGLASLPLLFAALFLGHRNKYVLVLLLTVFTCSAFITYTNRNLLVTSLAELVPLFKNIRTISDTLPRDAPIILLAVASGIGLDLLIASNYARKGELKTAHSGIERSLQWVLAVLTLIAVVSLLVSFLLTSPHNATSVFQWFPPGGNLPLPELKEAFAHIGVYLLLFSLLCLLVLLVRNPAHKLSLVLVLMFLVFFDLTISASAYWQRGKVWFKNEGTHALPHISRFAPVQSALQTWPGSYGGFIHNPFAGPFIGLRSWLPLATRPAWQPVLENWDTDLRVMKAYPDFRFYSGGTYIPFEKTMGTIDSVLPSKSGAQVYVHDKALAKDGPGEKLDAKWEVTMFTPNRVEVLVSMPRDGIMVFLDNYERFWSAEISGAAVPVRRANFTFKAIALPAGKHNVKWTYNPRPVKVFWLAFYCALILVIVTTLGWRLWTSVGLITVLVLGWGGIQYVVDRYMADRGKVDPRASPQLVTQIGQMRLHLSNGKTYPVVDGMGGYVEGVFPDDTGLTKIIGWAVDETALRPPEAIVATIRNQVWFSGRATVERPDIAALNPGYRYGGFHIFGRGASAADLGQLRLFALRADGKAVELRYSRGVTAAGKGG
jgi:hypothetical protein